MQPARALAPAVLLLATRPTLAQEPPVPSPPTPARGPLFRSAPEAAAPGASPPRVAVRLAYTRDPGAEACADEPGFRDAVAANIGYDPFTSTASRVAIVTIQRRGTMFVGSMELRGSTGTREWAHEPLSRKDCRELVRIMGLSIAIPIDPFPVQPPGNVPAPAPPPPSSITREAEPREPPPPPPPPPPPAAVRPKLRVGVRAGVELGTEPSTTGGFAVQVGVRWPLASVSVEGRADVPMAGAGNVAPMTRVTGGLFAGSLVPCAHVPLPARLDIPVCGLVTVGAFNGGGLSVEVQNRGVGLYVGAGGRTGLEIPVNRAGSIAVEVEGEVLGAVKPVTITLNGQDAWTTGRASGGAGGGVRFDF